MVVIIQLRFCGVVDDVFNLVKVLMIPVRFTLLLTGWFYSGLYRYVSCPSEALQGFHYSSTVLQQ